MNTFGTLKLFERRIDYMGGFKNSSLRSECDNIEMAALEHVGACVFNTVPNNQEIGEVANNMLTRLVADYATLAP